MRERDRERESVCVCVFLEDFPSLSLFHIVVLRCCSDTYTFTINNEGAAQWKNVMIGKSEEETPPPRKRYLFGASFLKEECLLLNSSKKNTLCEFGEFGYR